MQNNEIAEPDLGKCSLQMEQRSELSLLGLAAGSCAAKSLQKAAEKAPASADDKSWTYLVNLTASMMPNNWAGSGYKYKLLKGLEDQSKGSNSKIIVQQFDEKGMLSRYEIAGGKLREFAPVKSQGTARNLQSLVELAPKEGRVALLNQAHGKGDIGFSGDEEDLSVSAFEKSIKAGLAPSGRKSLDLLSMDSCLMANVQALDKLSSVSTNILASQLEMFSVVSISSDPVLTKYDMQPLDQYLSKWLQSPPKDGYDAANIAMAVSVADCKNWAAKDQGCGTPTIGIYDSAASPASARALDNFGRQLAASISDAESRKAVESLISTMKDLSINDFHLRDVDSFAAGIIKLIEEGKIKDAKGELKVAAQASLEANQKLVKQFYVSPESKIVQIKAGDGKSLRGLNVFLPGPDFNIRAESEELVGEREAKTLPIEVLLEKRIQASLPDASKGGWANFIRALHSKKR